MKEDLLWDTQLLLSVATGAVGAQMIKMLEESTLPIDKIRYLASARSAGKVLQFKGQDVTIEETTEDALKG